MTTAKRQSRGGLLSALALLLAASGACEGSAQAVPASAAAAVARGRPADSAAIIAEIRAFAGPIPDAATAARAGSAARRYETDFVRHDDRQWAQCGARWDCINYYDRALIYYVWWQRTGSPKYRIRADQVALNYRRAYLEPGDFGIAHHWSMSDGVALHYLATGDSASLVAVGKVADNFSYLVTADASGYIGNPAKMDNRIQAYALKALLAAYRLDARSVGIRRYGLPGGYDWPTVLRTALDKILGTRDADGQWRGAKCGPRGRATHPFAIGLLYDALIRYYELFEADPRIPEAIQRSADVLWREDWLANANAFKYVGMACPGEGGPRPAADLNNMIVNAYGWLYKQTGNPLYRQQADRIFAGGVNAGAVSNGPKWFNQNYTSSYRYLVWRSDR
ncbi:MAG TPA: hypothetical protein VLE53_09845 [Gemmatimonadaceae bacterium]|nr:hypothetical protein [Gemmatimonadaceae bacterium]